MAAGKLVGTLVAGLLLGGVFGFFAGGAFGGKVIVSHWIQTTANHASDTLDVLSSFRANQSAEGLDKLEMHLNRHLVGITPAILEGAVVKRGLREKIAEVKQTAIAYRTKYPRPASESQLEKDVAAFLGLKLVEKKAVEPKTEEPKAD